MLQDVISAVRADFSAGASTELRAQLNRSRSVALLAGNVVSNGRSDVSGVSARVYRSGSYGFSSMAELSEEAARSVLKAASENAAFMEKHAGRGKPALPKLPRAVRPLEKDISDPAQSVYIDFLRQVDAYITSHCPDLISRTVVASEDSMEKLLCTSDATDAHFIMPRSYVYVILTAATPDGKPVEMLPSPPRCIRGSTSCTAS